MGTASAVPFLYEKFVYILCCLKYNISMNSKAKYILLHIVILMVLMAVFVILSCSVKDGAKLEVHFIDVGEADAILVICQGHAMMIDGGDREDSQLIYAYLKERGITELDYIFATHSDSDHVGGLAAALRFLKVGSVYCSSDEADSRAFRSFRYYTEAQGLSIKKPEAGERFSLGDAELTVLGPTREAEEQNNNSIVIRLVYGETSFLFTGDMEFEEEADLLASGAELKSTLLKVAHHGSAYSTGEELLSKVKPKYAVISVGDNDYGHPAKTLLKRLEGVGAKVLRTDILGHIVFMSDGKDLTYTANRESSSARTLSEYDSYASEGYVLNKRSMVFHYPWCESVEKMSDANREYFDGSREELVEMGCSPCGICGP